ncbi:MAG: hypothetical protein E7618_04760 [Ruminococcaceae bacterium]|nr:hypothetical protein [Oscillospiraceae bacterium]
MKKSHRIAEAYLKQYVTLSEQLHIIDEQMFSSSRLLLLLDQENGREDSGENETLTALHRRAGFRQKELKVSRVAIEGKLAAIQGVLDRLPSVERRILMRFYIEGTFRMAASDLMDELGYEKSQIYRLRARALEHVFHLLGDSAAVLIPDNTAG